MYEIIRMYKDKANVTMATNLTLEEAQEHCKDVETSSTTCTSEQGLAHTEKHGNWFDGYSEA
tara:strand:+ start:90 stop:275 length:186 start_codon:yes stop_codon:yes gene_type:complete